MKQANGIAAGYWVATSLFALQMGFTAYAQLRLPPVAEAFTRLSFPAYFRVELSRLKLDRCALGLIVLLLPEAGAWRRLRHAGAAPDHLRCLGAKIQELEAA